jgi:hypothetical protein
VEKGNAGNVLAQIALELKTRTVALMHVHHAIAKIVMGRIVGIQLAHVSIWVEIMEISPLTLGNLCV